MYKYLRNLAEMNKDNNRPTFLAWRNLFRAIDKFKRSVRVAFWRWQKGSEIRNEYFDPGDDLI
jgi:hypothetical protein